MESKGYNIVIDNISEEVKIKNKTKKILSDLSLTINSGEFIAIVGCSGAGKTTLMNILSGYNKPSKGKVYINGLDILKEEEYFKGKIAYVPQEEILDQTLTLYKSLEYSLKLRVKGIKKEKIKSTINYVFKNIRIKSCQKYYN